MKRSQRSRAAFWKSLYVLAALGMLMAGAVRIEAGSYVFVNEAFPNTVTHPSNYDPTVGGVVTVSVCIDPAAADAAAMEIPVQNIVGVINSLTPQSPNLILGGANNIPTNFVDFESLTLHEFGHCIGLGHPNLGVQTGVSGANTDYTQAGDGANNMFAFNDGADNVIGSSDDLRDDDVNFHWFFDNANNPFAALPGTIDSTNYTRNLGDLPGGHNFAANASRDVGTPLGFPNTEAVMQQGQGFDEDQRALQADDVASLRFAMAGLDEVAGTPDDYTINMVYAGQTTSCDIVIKSTSTGFGACSISFTLTDPTGTNQDHLTIASAQFTYNSVGFDWFFNDQLTSCSAGDNNLTVTGTDTGTETYEACTSITMGPYTASASSTVTVTAPLIEMKDNTSIAGTFVAENAVP